MPPEEEGVHVSALPPQAPVDSLQVIPPVVPVAHDAVRASTDAVERTREAVERLDNTLTDFIARFDSRLDDTLQAFVEHSHIPAPVAEPVSQASETVTEVPETVAALPGEAISTEAAPAPVTQVPPKRRNPYRLR